MSDGLIPSLGSPPGQPTPVGVQPGTTPGVVLAQFVIVFGASGGIFLYSGKPGPGNPPVAWMSTGTQDPYKNTLTPKTGGALIGAGQDGNPQVVLALSGAAGQLAFPLPGTWTNYPNVFGEVVGGGGTLSINGPTDTTVNDQAYAELLSAAAGFDGGSAGALHYIDANGGDNTIAIWGDDGLLVNVSPNMFAVKPGTGGSPTNPAVQETWHAMTPFLNGWANAAGNVAAQYRKVASPPNSVEIIGAITATAATAGNFFTLPAGYRPVSAQQIPVGATGGVTAATVSPFITCNAAGALTTQEIGLGAANIVVFHGTIALDA